MDLIAEFQHEKRITIHDVKGLRTVLANGKALYERDGEVRQLEQAIEWGISRADAILHRLDPTKEV